MPLPLPLPLPQTLTLTLPLLLQLPLPLLLLLPLPLMLLLPPPWTLSRPPSTVWWLLLRPTPGGAPETAPSAVPGRLAAAPETAPVACSPLLWSVRAVLFPWLGRCAPGRAPGCSAASAMAFLRR